jgi:hypothetical protein
MNSPLEPSLNHLDARRSEQNGSRVPGSTGISTLISLGQGDLTVLLCASGFVGPLAIDLFDGSWTAVAVRDHQGEAVVSSPAGWYPQPDGRQRYWDGELWTENFAPGVPTVGTPEVTGSKSVLHYRDSASAMALHSCRTAAASRVTSKTSRCPGAGEICRR